MKTSLGVATAISGNGPWATASGILTKECYTKMQEEEDKTPHSMRSEFNCMTQTGLRSVDGPFKNKFKKTDENLTWTIELPGIKAEDIDVRFVDPNLRVTAPVPGRLVKESISIILAPEELVSRVTLERGLLTIVTDRNIFIEAYPVEEPHICGNG